MNIYLVIFITLLAALVASLSQTIYKKSLGKRLEGLKDIIRMFFKRNILIGVAGYLLSLAIYLVALSKAPLSIVYPTFASTFIFVTILSHVVLKEKLGAMRIAGMIVVFFGITIIALTL